jgi:hypothetical protein
MALTPEEQTQLETSLVVASAIWRELDGSLKREIADWDALRKNRTGVILRPLSRAAFEIIEQIKRVESAGICWSAQLAAGVVQPPWMPTATATAASEAPPTSTVALKRVGGGK